MKLLLVVLVTIIINGCASIQEQYKPLYQVKPEIKKLEVK